ncbi:MAG: sporulation protein YqfD [Firmicutes bacterium]|nr:sporulation protein YqfD [Bacillota bacterium]
MPVELVTVKYLELADYREERGREGALKLARERALEEVAGQLPKDAVVLDRRVEEVNTAHPENVVRVKAVIEAVEEIGAEKLFKPPEGRSSQDNNLEPRNQKSEFRIQNRN